MYTKYNTFTVVYYILNHNLAFGTWCIVNEVLPHNFSACICELFMTDHNRAVCNETCVVSIIPTTDTLMEMIFDQFLTYAVVTLYGILCYNWPCCKRHEPTTHNKYIYIFLHMKSLKSLFHGSLKPFTFTGKPLIMGDQWVIWCCEWNEMVCHQIDWQVHFFFIFYKPNNLVYSELEKDLFGIISRNRIIGTTDIMH